MDELHRHQHRQQGVVWTTVAYLLVGLTLCMLSLLVPSAHAQAVAQIPPQAVSFGAGRALHLIDPTGHNTFPFWTTGGNTVDFSLHPLDPTTFVQRYTLYSPYNPTPIDVTGLPVTLQWQQTFTATTDSTQRAVRLPPEQTTATTPTGLYIIRASNPQLGTATALIAISRHVLVVKRGSGGQVVLWATDLQKHTPVKGMAITLYDRAGATLAQGITNPAGTLTLNVGTATPQMVMGEIATPTGTDITVSGLDWQWRVEENFWLWSEPPTQQFRTYLHTDRPLYRPGQTIYYQALLRQNLNSGYALPKQTELVTVELFDSRENLVDSIETSPDAFGAVDGSFLLSDEPPLGVYQLTVTVAGERTQQEVHVEAYRKPEYAVSVTTPAAFAISGDPLPLTITAAYFFGQPVANAAVEVKLYRTRRYSGWDGWWRSGISNDTGNDIGNDTSQESLQIFTGSTDSQGRWQTTITPTADEMYDTRYTVEATVTDARGEPLLGVAKIDIYRHTVALTAQSDRYGYAMDEAVAIQLRTTAHDGTPQANKHVTVRIVQPSYDDGAETDVMLPQQLTTAVDGTATATFMAIPSGWYRVLATTMDDRNQPINTESYLWIYESGIKPSGSNGSSELTIVADRSSYVPGDVAQLLIQSPVTGIALLALERAGVHTEQVIAIEGPFTTVALPITADFMPNIFAQIHIFAPTDADDQQALQTEGHLLTAQTELSVPATEQKLQVTVTGDAQQYIPGSSAQLTVQVTDQHGGPIHARVALALVDEALFALQADLSGDLFTYFYGPTTNGVATFHSLARQTAQWFYPPVEDRDGTLPPDSMDGSGSALSTRHNFQDTAYWNSHIETDANGLATVTILLPDNLTTWRVIARAVTQATAVGESQSTLLVTQPLLARPVLPRFALLGDQFRSSTIAQNFTASGTSGQIALTAPQFTILDQAEEQIDLPIGSSTVTHWTTIASQLGTEMVTTTLATTAGQDQVAIPFPIKPFAVPERWTAAGIAAPTATETFTLPFNAINDATTLTVQLSPSLALGMLDGLADLIDYPYGCVEQTMSRILPSAVAAHAFTELGIVNPKAEELPAIMTQGLQKLYGFQHSNGSWGWFYDDDGGVYLTAYVLFGLTQVQATGTSVDNEVLADGFTYLDHNLANVDDVAIKAYALYVKAMAGRGDLAQAQALVVDRNALEGAALAALSLALQHDGDIANAQLVADALLQQVIETATTAYWPLPTTGWNWSQWQTMASAEKNTALALQALQTLQPDHPLLPKVVRWLMQAREGAGWRNTQATALAILGLVDYSLLHHELDAAYSYRVLLNNAEMVAGAITPQTNRQPIRALTIPGTAIPNGSNVLTIERSAAEAPLYYSIHIDQAHFYDRYHPVDAVDHGIQMVRNYQLIEGTPRNDGAYNVGDLVQVTINLTVKERMAYVLVEDPIPAGFEVLNERLNPVSYGDEVPFFWHEWGYNRKNVRDDRVDFFLTTLWAGKTTLTYLMRATTPGLFGVPPGQASPMYNDDFWGRSGSSVIGIAPELLTMRPELSGDFDGDCQISHFDAQLVAAAWGTTSIQRNVIADTQIDLSDVAAVVARTGATCLQDQQIPITAGGQAALTVNIGHQQYQLGTPIAVTIRPSQFLANGREAIALGGYGIQLQFDPTLLEVAEVQWHQQDARTLPLGPQVNLGEGIVQLGAYGFATQQAKMDEALVTIIFVGKAVGTTTISAVAGEAVDLQGRLLQTTTTTTHGTLTIDGRQLFLPMVHR